MADISPENAAEGVPSLPEIPLKWDDFEWSLEKLRHRPYGKKTRERDWFRVNPLEMVLLGAQSLATNTHTKRDHGTMVLVMPPLRRELNVRPRYWQRLVSVLYLATQEVDTPPIVIQRCCTALIGLFKALRSTPEFYPTVIVWAVYKLKVVEGFERLLEKSRQQLGSELSFELEELLNSSQSTAASAEGCWGELIQSEEETLSGERVKMRTFLTAALQSCSSVSPDQSIQLQLHEMLSTDVEIHSSVIGKDWTPFQELFKYISNISTQALASLLSIIQLVFVRGASLKAPSTQSSTSVGTGLVNNLALTEPDIEQQNITLSPGAGGETATSEYIGVGQTATINKEGDDETNEPASVGKNESDSGIVQADVKTETEEEEKISEPFLAALCQALLFCSIKWERLCFPEPSSLASVVCQLLSLTEAILSAYPLHKSPAVSFLNQPISLLMTYSTEGYLSNSPNEFFVELLEFVTPLVEHQTSPHQALQTNLPNLFGPMFGIHDHSISCQLLEYGSLAVCSQHQKSLLTEGLRFLVDTFHLFPPIDKVKAHAAAISLRREAVEVCSQLLEDLLSSLILEGGQLETEKLISVEQWPTETGCASFGDQTGGGDFKDDQTASLKGQSVVSEAESRDTTACPVNHSVVTDAEREDDKRSRIQVLLRLIQLACMMVRRGDNISFIFASVLPKLFVQPAEEPILNFNVEKLTKFFGESPPRPTTNISWKVDKKKLAVQLLDLTILAMQCDMGTPFQLCGITAPKLIKNIDRLSMTDEEKLSLTLDVLKITQDILEEGHSINDFISHGIDLLSILLPDSASGEEFRQLSSQMARHFVTSSQSSLLFLIKVSCQFMTKHFPDEESGIRELFSSLVFKGKRDEIRCVFRVCKPQLTRGQYSRIRQHLYRYAGGQLTHRQLVALCELLVVAMDVETPRRAVREVVSNVVEEDEQLAKEREDQISSVVSRLITPSLRRIEEALQEGRFKKAVWEDISRQLSHVALFSTLFKSEFSALSSLNTVELMDSFTKKFPPEVLSSDETMQLLAQCATRIEHMQSPRYDSLKTLLISHLRHFLTLTPSQATPILQDKPTESKDTLELRKSQFQHHLDGLPRNVEDKRQLVECGYSNQLWEEGISLTVQTDGSRSLEENMRQTLLACYAEFSEILKQMAITHVSVDGELVKSSQLFSEELSLAELKGRRAITVRAIDQRLGQSKDGHFYERKVTLLSREDQIETDFDNQARAPVKPKTFTVALNTNFFSCARCCGPQIIGCYAPNGEHCERPLEIGVRCDSAIASIYDESGLEIENVEILLTQEGAYIFKAYSNGHPYDTSQVWSSLFVVLLKEEPSCLVPAIIVPNGYPNTRTWEALRRVVSTEITGSVLTCRHDFSPEWRTYYDHRPEGVRLGTDIVLTPGFSLTANEGRPALRRQQSRLTKDLAGTIFEEMMQKLLDDDWLKQFRFLGKVMSEYISVSIREGKRRLSILEEGFNYDRWVKTFCKSKQIQDSTIVPSKEDVVMWISKFIDKEMVTWLECTDIRQLCSHNTRQLLELKAFLERDTHFTKYRAINKKLVLIRQLLRQCTVVLPIASLSDALQEEIIHWVFGNEDRVWRYRGGRDGHETLQQFMYFLGKQPLANQRSEATTEQTEVIAMETQKIYPGVVAFCLPELLEDENGQLAPDVNALEVQRMTGYAVGEMMKPLKQSEGTEEGEESSRWKSNTPDHCYEVVTAWVHPSYRGLNMGVQMYFNIVEQAPARLVMCDMLVGSVERIIQSNVLLRLLRRMRIVGMVVQKRQLSYTVVTQAGHSEQFEQVLFDARPLRLMLKLHRAVKWCGAHPKLTLATVAMVVSTPIIVLAVTKLL